MPAVPCAESLGLLLSNREPADRWPSQSGSLSVKHMRGCGADASGRLSVRPSIVLACKECLIAFTADVPVEVIGSKTEAALVQDVPVTFTVISETLCVSYFGFCPLSSSTNESPQVTCLLSFIFTSLFPPVPTFLSLSLFSFLRGNPPSQSASAGQTSLVVAVGVFDDQISGY